MLLLALLPAPGWSDPPTGASEVDGSAAKSLLKQRSASLRVYAFRDRSPVMIPFQVDERDHHDHWADDFGSDPVRDETPGIFDENDLIVFMNRDLGAQGDVGRLPSGASQWLEVRVGPKDAPLGYAYVGAFEAPPRLPSDAAYARYDPAKDEVTAERYAVRFGGPLPTYLAIGPPDGKAADNVLTDVRVHGEARILRGLFRFERTEKDVRYTVHGYRNGPVRAIRSAKYWIRLPLGFKARGRVELLFYRDFVEGRARVNIKIPPRLVPADGEMTAYFDFRNFLGARVLGPGGELAEPIDGHMTVAKRAFADKNMRWSSLLLPGGRAFLLAVRLEGSLQRLDQRLYLDDSNDPPSGRPAFGFRLSGVNRLDTGEQELSVNAMILDTTTPVEIEAAARRLLEKPEVAITPLKRP